MNKRVQILSLIGLALACAQLHAEVIQFSPGAWEIEAVESRIVDHMGQQALFLKGGIAWPKNVSLTNGVIEFDTSFSPDRGFAGCVFRMADTQNFENFYLRPHQSGKPDANQYTPVFNGVSAWQLYHGDGYGIPVAYRFDEWIHVKIEFFGKRARVYIDSDTPVLFIDDLKRDVASGAAGFSVSNFAPAWFANFSIHPLDKDFSNTGFSNSPIDPPDDMVRHWSVSNPFLFEEIKDTTRIDESIAGDLSWRSLDAEKSGITNLARLNGVSEQGDTVFARFVIESADHHSLRLGFGYSDNVRVFANGQWLYSGSNFYQSRDYRYLGTIGLFDELVIPLNPGKNEIWFAVQEQFGGWGIIAQFRDIDGLISTTGTSKNE